jgi:hypothetical protein
MVTRLQHEILRQTLGMGGMARRRGQPGYRNYFEAGPRSTSYRDVLALVDAGLLSPGNPVWGTDRRFYHATEAGIARAVTPFDAFPVVATEWARGPNRQGVTG